MSEKVKVTVAQAVEFDKKGFVVECYVMPGFAFGEKKTNRSSNNPIIHPNTMLALGLKGREPAKGILGVAWQKTKKELWEKDLTKHYTRTQVAKSLAKNGNPDASAIAYLVNKCGCLVRLSEAK